MEEVLDLILELNVLFRIMSPVAMIMEIFLHVTMLKSGANPFG